MPPKRQQVADTAREDAPVVGDVVVTGDVVSIEQCAKDWCRFASSDADEAAFIAVRSLFELSSLGATFERSAMSRKPQEFLAELPQRLQDDSAGLAYPLFPPHLASKSCKRAAAGYERFWTSSLLQQSTTSLLQKGLLSLICHWLADVSRAALRPLRHAAVVAAWAVLDALAQHTQLLEKNLFALRSQVEGATGRKANALPRQIEKLEAERHELDRCSEKLLKAAFDRTQDICEVIRLHCMEQMQRLSEAHPSIYLQRRWMDEVLTRLMDDSPELRSKALILIRHWYTLSKKPPADTQQILNQFAQDNLAKFADRIFDVDRRVAIAALHCVRAPTLGEALDDETFEKVVGLCFRSEDHNVREEAAVFINMHVFQEPGICLPSLLNGSKQGKRGEDGMEDTSGSGSSLMKMLNSETCISMLVEFLEGYLAEELCYTDRVVRAFWGKAPCLEHWNTMVSLCLLGESAAAVIEPITARQRSCVLHLMEAGIRLAEEEQRQGKPVGQQRLEKACELIFPELPSLFKVSSADDQQMLLLSHVAKMLLEFAAECKGVQARINSKEMCNKLCTCIRSQAAMDTLRFAVEALKALSRCSDEVQVEATQLASQMGRHCQELLSDISANRSDLKLVLLRCAVLQNAGWDVSTLGASLPSQMRDLLQRRADVMAKLVLQKTDDSSVFPTTDGSVPDSFLMLLLIEVSVLMLMWNIRVAMALQGMQAQGCDEQESAVNVSDLSKDLQMLRHSCTAIVANDRCPYVRLHAFCAYTWLLQVAHGAKTSMDLAAYGASARAWADKFDTAVPKGHMNALWTYLNGLYISLDKEAIKEIKEASKGIGKEGLEVSVKDIFPAPLQEGNVGLTAQRFLLQRRMEGRDQEEIVLVDSKTRLLFAVVASGSILDSDVHAIQLGPVGQLVLTQCEASRPALLREVAQKFLKKLLDCRPQGHVKAEAFFRTLKDTIRSMYDCCDQRAAASLAREFSMLSGFKTAPGVGEGLLEVLKELALGVITPDKTHLCLLDLLGSWAAGTEGLPQEQLREVRRVVERTAIKSGLSIGEETSIFQFLQALQPKEGGDVLAPTPLQVPDKRITGKRPKDELLLPEAEQKRSRVGADAPSS